MSADKLKAQLTGALLDISEKCVTGALVAAGMVVTGHGASAMIAPKASQDNTETIAAAAETAAPAAEGAINLSFVSTDPNTGEQVAQHYSHASHASHASHYSHYSSRY
jgi:hypothetical protein